MTLLRPKIEYVGPKIQSSFDRASSSYRQFFGGKPSETERLSVKSTVVESNTLTQDVSQPSYSQRRAVIDLMTRSCSSTRTSNSVRILPFCPSFFFFSFCLLAFNFVYMLNTASWPRSPDIDVFVPLRATCSCCNVVFCLNISKSTDQLASEALNIYQKVHTFVFTTMILWY